MSDNKKEERFIEVERVLADINKINYGTEKEFINVSEIKSFRPWHKGKNDHKIKGDMTIIVLNHSKELNTINDNVMETNVKFRTMLISEKCNEFAGRLKYKAQVVFIVPEDHIDTH